MLTQGQSGPPIAWHPLGYALLCECSGHLVPLPPCPTASPIVAGGVCRKCRLPVLLYWVVPPTGNDRHAEQMMVAAGAEVTRIREAMRAGRRRG